MPITEQQLLQILPNAGPRAGIFVPSLIRAMLRFKIDTPKRQAAFLAQVGHESGQLKSLVENLNYSADGLANSWSSRYAEPDGKGGYLKVDVKGRLRNKPNALALSLAGKPEQIANNVYASRMGNGSPVTGDGWKYRGRGLIQVTGKSNYIAAGTALQLDLLNQPELLEQADWAVMSAAHYWDARGLSDLADAGAFQDIGSIINTGQQGRVPNGAEDRKALYDKALKVLA
ncbi:glycoside hydrolase family 19 protein [Pseudomonas kairouanensis]|uniref:Glycoside hydrolase family 19 protein n=1 Tax=Pseudomonas kairouanensis TaxID=2293832 RepID=A0A4Z0AIU8_9PSED|nr:glycoside hydrolase family 19 protein [Pseudomonas kairouanensis]TFY86706.1 glycoside hydrolase family 19 protein [Pseudomonas kairouanensis]